jgi:hypothetical protein
MMLRRTALRPRRQNAPRPDWKVAEAFKQWLRGRECACGGSNPDCSGKIQAAHVPHKGSKGIGTKVADRYCIPLSEGCHLHTQHRIGWPEFARKYLHGQDPESLAGDYWHLWPGRIAWERKQEGHG